LNEAAQAVRAVVRGQVHGVGFRDATVAEAHRLGLMGWVRSDEDGVVRVHAEGEEQRLADLVAFLREGLSAARVAELELEPAPLEGHEQFAIRGVSAGPFVVLERIAPSRGFELRLEVAGAMRSWAIPKGPSLDPAVKRFGIEVADIDVARAERGVSVWDQGMYEQGGRVPWPEALARGHAMFVLQGAKLRGGFAPQRTRSGDRGQWLLIKRRDEHARPGSDITADGAGRD
jgi:DNA ligase D-like protein (predicted 3'-phosphoesterase)